MANRPGRPTLPNYLLDPLDRQSPEKLDAVAEYASQLAAWKRQQRVAEEEERRQEQAVSQDQLDDLTDRGYSIDPDDYEDVPSSGAYITVKTTKRSAAKSYRYYYWQWREGDTWVNEYIGPVDAEHDS